MPGFSELSTELLKCVLIGVRPCDVASVAPASRTLAVAVSDEQVWATWAAVIGATGGREGFYHRVRGHGGWQRQTWDVRGVACDMQLCAAAGLADGSVLIHGGRRGLGLLSLAGRQFVDGTYRVGVPKAFDAKEDVGCDWQAIDSNAGASPGARADHAACVLQNRFFVVHGGLRPEGYRDNDTFVLDVAAAAPKWREVVPGSIHDPRRPTARFHHTFTPLGSGSAVVVAGGHDRTISAIEDLAILEAPDVNGEWAWRLQATVRQYPGRHGAREFGVVGMMGEPRAWHSATAMLDGSHIAIFGGLDSDADALDTLWLLDIETERGAEVIPDGPRPPARCRHGALACGTQLLIIGGCSELSSSQGLQHPFDLWTIDLAHAGDGTRATRTWERLAFSALALDCARWPRPWLHPTLGIHEGHLFVFGGYHSFSGFDHFGDPSRVETREIAGDAQGSLLVVPWHRLFRSRRWRILSAELSGCHEHVAVPIVTVQEKGQAPCLIGASQHTGSPTLAMFSLVLGVPSSTVDATAARAYSMTLPAITHPSATSATSDSACAEVTIRPRAWGKRLADLLLPVTYICRRRRLDVYGHSEGLQKPPTGCQLSTPS